MGEISSKAPSGFRDFRPKESAKRQELIKKIEEQYRLHGFQCIITSSCEKLSNLEGKGAGMENEHLIFKLQKRGEALKKVFLEGLSSKEDKQNKIDFLCQHSSDLGLRPELTLPLVRYVSQFRKELVFPAKLFQIAPVWRAERPQRGRYREFIQCDVDIIGCKSIGAELHCLQAMLAAIDSVGNIKTKLKINDRRFINAIGKKIELPPALFKEILILLDKLPKLGKESIEEELKKKIPPLVLDKLKQYFFHPEAKELEYWEKIHKEGFQSLKKLFALLQTSSHKNLLEIEFEPSLVRGQEYYTGTIFELEILDAAGSSEVHKKNHNSIAAGGRYDNLFQLFAAPPSPAFGASIGFERLFLATLEAESSHSSFPLVFFPLFDEDKREIILPILEQLRERKIPCELYPEVLKLKKQFKYANDKNIPWSVSLGSEELNKKVLIVKDMKTGKENSIPMKSFVQEMEKLCHAR